MKRREFVGKLGLGSAALASLSGGTAAAAGKGNQHDHESVDGPLANATVSFGAWPSGGDTPLDRLLGPPNAPDAPNIHRLIPYITTIKAGGTVNFVIAGFHLVAVYGPGTKPEDINASITVALPGAPFPGFPPAINDASKRVYRGLNPLTVPQDRVEVVQFPTKGRFLVICAFLPHFNDNMYGYVKVN